MRIEWQDAALIGIGVGYFWIGTMMPHNFVGLISSFVGGVMIGVGAYYLIKNFKKGRQ